MPETILGKVSVTPKGAYAAGTQYERLDAVSHGWPVRRRRVSNPAPTPKAGCSWPKRAKPVIRVRKAHRAKMA